MGAVTSEASASDRGCRSGSNSKPFNVVTYTGSGRNAFVFGCKGTTFFLKNIRFPKKNGRNTLDLYDIYKFSRRFNIHFSRRLVV